MYEKKATTTAKKKKKNKGDGINATSIKLHRHCPGRHDYAINERDYDLKFGHINAIIIIKLHGPLSIFTNDHKIYRYLKRINLANHKYLAY